MPTYIFATSSETGRGATPIKLQNLTKQRSSEAYVAADLATVPRANVCARTARALRMVVLSAVPRGHGVLAMVEERNQREVRCDIQRCEGV